MKARVALLALLLVGAGGCFGPTEPEPCPTTQTTEIITADGESIPAEVGVCIVRSRIP